MKIIKKFIFVLVSLLIISAVSINVSADLGPKPYVTIEISGMGNETYTATLISQEASGPNFTYDDYLENNFDHIEYHPIMEYEDSDGYKWIGRYWELHGEAEFNWSYYPPNNFKILIMTEDNQYYTTNAVDRYAFSTYYKVDISKAVEGEVEAVKVIEVVEPNYNYFKEIGTFLIRLVLTVAIEIGLALLFGFRKKSQIITILIVNVITQVLLNAMLNITTYFQGQLVAMAFFAIGEIFVLAAESTFYVYYFKNQRLKGLLYSLTANIISFGAGFGLYLLENIIFR